MRRLIPLAVLLALAGCDAFSDDTRGVDLAVRETRVAPGDEIIAVLDNDSRRAVAYGCPVLGRVESGTFTPATPDQVCSQMLVSVEAGGTVAFRVRMPETAAAGTYAVRVSVGRETPDAPVSSDPFVVAQ